MAFTTIPGLPGGPLVTTYPIRMNLIAIDGYQPTGQPAHTPRWWVLTRMRTRVAMDDLAERVTIPDAG
jgi:hypothetical protein